LLELLQSAGYDVASAATQEEGFAIVQNGGVDLFLLSADLSDLQCCNALAEVKGLATTASTRVILLTHGEGVERARGLDLGADDVLSAQWDAAELLARVRVQLRVKRAYDELREKARLAEEGQEIAQTAFQALAVTEKMTRERHHAESSSEDRCWFPYFRRCRYRGRFSAVLAARGQGRRNARIRSSRSLNTASTGRELVSEARKMRADLQETDTVLQKGLAPEADRGAAAEDFERGWRRHLRFEKATGRSNGPVEACRERVRRRGTGDSILCAERLPAACIRGVQR